MNIETIKSFTATEATRMLPLIRRIVQDILDVGNLLKTISRETMTGDNASILELRVAELKGYIKELEELGCTYRDWDFKAGVVDFPTQLEGRPAFLSWRSDEETVDHFYYQDENLKNRRPLPDDARIG